MRPSIIHVAEDMDVLAGGVPAVVRQLSKRLSELGYELTLAHVSGDASDLGDIATIIKCVPHGFLRSWRHSPELASCLEDSTPIREQTDSLFHIHGVWKAPQVMAARYSAKSSIPCLFSVHGMLEPWLWKKQGIVHRLKKRCSGLCSPRTIYLIPPHCTLLLHSNVITFMPCCRAVKLR